jgi:hypothetical protein
MTLPLGISVVDRLSSTLPQAVAKTSKAGEHIGIAPTESGEKPGGRGKQRPYNAAGCLREGTGCHPLPLLYEQIVRLKSPSTRDILLRSA